ncbi:MAG: right-handed parallel beta-helix repeat-containing protein [Bacteroidota bacterium]
MTNLLTRLLVLFALACVPLSGFSTNYYVAKSGNDSNDGSESQPFLTISKASSVLQAGDSCFVKAGIYRERLAPANDGTAFQPIVYMAYKGEEVIVSATEEITSWSLYQDDIYQTSINMSLGPQNMLYYEGKTMDIAQWPNNTDNSRFIINTAPVTGGGAGEITANNIPDFNWTGGYVWYLGAHSGASWTRQITASSTQNIQYPSVDISKWPFSVHNPTVFRNGNRGQFMLFGKLEALDYQREWYYDSAAGTLYFKAPSGADPNGGKATYAVRERTIDINRDYITVDGIGAFGGRVVIKGDGCILRNGIFSHCLNTLDALDNVNAQLSTGAVAVQGNDVLVQNNIIEYGSTNGIWVQGWGNLSGIRLEGNVVRYFNTIGNHSNGIRCNAAGSVIERNTIYQCGRDGIYMSAPNGEIAYNDIFECMLINNDGGIFYTVGNDNDKNTSIHHNWFHDSYGPEYADGRAAGIYLDNDSKGYDVHHNLVWNITWSAVQMNWDAWNNDIFNNSFWNVGQAMGAWLNGRQLINNRIWNNYAPIGDWEGNDFQNNLIDSNDPFGDRSMRDFRPAVGSPLIDAGMLISGITDGYNGAAPDIGAYEYGDTIWTAGAERFQSDFPTPIEELLQADGLKIGPNPCREQLNLLLELDYPQEIGLGLYALDGKLVLKQTTKVPASGEHKFSLQVADLPAGIYVLRTSLNGQSLSRRVVLRK